MDAGHPGDMEYLQRHETLKEHPDQLLEGVQSAIVLSKSYRNAPPSPHAPDLKIARYAAGRDYHQIIGERLSSLEAELSERFPRHDFYSGVDSRPIAERDLALAAGIGFRGRNSMIITPGQGSYFFLAVILTTLPLPPDAPSTVNCGTCRACVDACPTDVISMDGGFDAQQCISYTTIEKKSPMTASEHKSAEGWIFGCDICQEVCPFNKESLPMTDWPEFLPESGMGFNLTLTENEVKPSRKTPLYRSRKRLIENVRFRQAAD